MNNWPEISLFLPAFRAIAEKQALATVLDVVTEKCAMCVGAGAILSRYAGHDYQSHDCPRCYGTSRILRDMSDWPDGALAGAWKRLLKGKEYWCRRLRYMVYPDDDTDDLAMTRAVLEAIRRTFG